MVPLSLRDLGRADYSDTLALQRDLVSRRLADEVPDTLILVEHPPVITLGRTRGAAEHVVDSGSTPVIPVERGGDVTWHGPGQLVGYPIIKLDAHERDVVRVLRNLESAFVGLACELGLDALTRPGYTGVWARPAGAAPSAGPKKIVSLGIAVRRWVTFHGFALNVDCDLEEFGRIVPCGLEPRVMGSLASLGARVPAPHELRFLVAERVATSLGRRLSRDPGWDLERTPLTRS